jgi:type II secretory pathway pseudopilin PulG
VKLSGQLRRERLDNGGRPGQQGYMLLAIILMLALIVIAAAAAAPDIAMSIRREREAEMIHRGTQYMRAIQHYYKKFGRYPTRIEDLENTNNMRFLRRRYKDPITGKEFRLLHFGEVNLGAVMGMSGAGAGLMGGAAAAAMSGAFGQGRGANPSMLAQQAASMLAQQAGGAMAGPPGTPLQGMSGSTSTSMDTQATKVFGGGPIIGVASTSHKTSIREFNKKNHYNDWYFIYDPSLDRGGLVKGPAQPPIPGTGGSVVGATGAGVNQGAGPTGSGSPGFGNPMPGFGNPSLQGPGAMIPAQPQAQPQQ